mgnify:CR=1 FL=1
MFKKLILNGLTKSKSDPEMIPCPCGGGHLIPRLAIVNRCPLLFAMALTDSSRLLNKPHKDE